MENEEIGIIIVLVFLNGGFLLFDSTVGFYLAGYALHYSVFTLLFLQSTIPLEAFLLGLIVPPFTIILHVFIKRFLFRENLFCTHCEQNNAGVKIHERTLGFVNRPVIGFKSGVYMPTARYAKIQISFRCKYCNHEWSVNVHERL